ncbi:NAD(P)H-dependent oxidoreductase [Acinetobacter sp.]|uniref:NAD(P)H-dependent oxidoreductase n=1 Tax=Acinetobacter sp. TaxID=472 RepID=UPI00282BF078|nr:NAD(P)H-dependent oxidoreductase [Acinetobacter sp.]MDR0238195.1 NAD(P)H-dependent oxidoreductase [Acinetobacter sp.]
MKCLVVIAHPINDRLCHHMAKTAIARLIANGHEVVVEDLYASGFSPALTDEERQSYYSPVFDQTAVKDNIDDLLSAEALVLVFPTWWFGFPAILKGWFDRIWAPGVAYDHANDLGAIQPKLDNLKYTLAITSLGAAWWVDRLVLWQPVKRILKIALLSTCVPKCHFQMLSLYKAESLTQVQIASFCARIEAKIASWPK